MAPFSFRASATALALVLPALGLGACGGAATTKSSNANSILVEPNFSTHHNDRDNDGDHNDDDGKVLYYGYAADAADRQASTLLVRRYFAAAAGEDGASGCTMLAPLIAEMLVEEDGNAPALRGGTCAEVLSKLFAEHHRELALKNKTLRILEVRSTGEKELVVLDFPTIPEVRQITARRMGGRWKLMETLDGILE